MVHALLAPLYKNLAVREIARGRLVSLLVDRQAWLNQKSGIYGVHLTLARGRMIFPMRVSLLTLPT